MQSYDDIIECERPELPQYPRMPVEDRAAQFSPFAALTGHSAAIEETARLTDDRIELEEDEYERLDETLRVIRAHLQERPRVKLTYFVKDPRKRGGSYKTMTDCITAVDEYRGSIQVRSGEWIAVEDITALDYMAEWD